MIKTNQALRFDPRYKSYLLSQLVFYIILLALAFSITNPTQFLISFFSSAMLFGIPAYIVIALVYHYRYYTINDHDLTINSGIIARRSKTIPFKSIQNIHQKQGLIMRLFKIVNVEIWTASASQMKPANASGKNYPDGLIVLSKIDAQSFQDHSNKYNQSR